MNTQSEKSFRHWLDILQDKHSTPGRPEDIGSMLDMLTDEMVSYFVNARGCSTLVASLHAYDHMHAYYNQIAINVGYRPPVVEMLVMSCPPRLFEIKALTWLSYPDDRIRFQESSGRVHEVVGFALFFSRDFRSLPSCDPAPLSSLPITLDGLPATLDAIKFLKEKMQNAKCDHEASSECLRCNIFYLINQMEAYVKLSRSAAKTDTVPAGRPG